MSKVVDLEELIKELRNQINVYERQITDLQKRNSELVEENRRLRNSVECKIEESK